jgi:hypothetical protein
MKTLRKKAVKPTRSERYVVQKVVQFLRAMDYRTACEVPSMGQSIDVVALKGRWLMCVEVKLADWRRGLGQCRAHRLVADYVALAVATAHVPASLREAAAAAGVGIIHFDRSLDTCVWALRPTLIREMWPPQRRQLSSAIRDIGYEG